MSEKTSEPKINNLIFLCLAWAGFLKDWPGPKAGERPTAYIIILHDTKIKKITDIDCGVAAQSILLGAAEQDLGGCMIGSVKKTKLRKALKITSQYEILLVIALGKPKEKVVLEEAAKNASIKYWRDKKDVHHVPKRKLDDILVGNK